MKFILFSSIFGGILIGECSSLVIISIAKNRGRNLSGGREELDSEYLHVRSSGCTLVCRWFQFVFLSLDLSCLCRGCFSDLIQHYRQEMVPHTPLSSIHCWLGSPLLRLLSSNLHHWKVPHRFCRRSFRVRDGLRWKDFKNILLHSKAFY